MKLGEIGTFYGGLSGKTKNDFENGNAKYITYKNIYDNIALCLDIKDTVKIQEGERQNTVQYGDILFTGSSETPEECGMSSVLTQKTEEPLYLNSFCFGFRPNDLSLLSPNFAKHLFRSYAMRKQICRTASGVTRFNVSKAKMADILIPIPPLAEQERIVGVLDRFEEIVGDLEQGLPAEIRLTRQRYEYYRSRLFAQLG